MTTEFLKPYVDEAQMPVGYRTMEIRLIVFYKPFVRLLSMNYIQVNNVMVSQFKFLVLQYVLGPNCYYMHDSPRSYDEEYRLKIVTLDSR